MPAMRADPFLRPAQFPVLEARPTVDAVAQLLAGEDPDPSRHAGASLMIPGDCHAKVVARVSDGKPDRAASA